MEYSAPNLLKLVFTIAGENEAFQQNLDWMIPGSFCLVTNREKRSTPMST